MHRYIYEKAKNLQRTVDVRADKAESIGLKENQFDAVISTLVLCSVSELETALSEIKRVLKPGGQFLFIEHVAAQPGSRLRTIQGIVRPVWRWLADGCIVDREVASAIEQAGFSSTDIQPFNAPVPFTTGVIRPHIRGIAVK